MNKLGLIILAVISLCFSQSLPALAGNGRAKAKARPIVSFALEQARSKAQDILWKSPRLEVKVAEIHMPNAWHRIVVVESTTYAPESSVLDFWKGHDGWDGCLSIRVDDFLSLEPTAKGYVPNTHNPLPIDLISVSNHRYDY